MQDFFPPEAATPGRLQSTDAIVKRLRECSNRAAPRVRGDAATDANFSANFSANFGAMVADHARGMPGIANEYEKSAGTSNTNIAHPRTHAVLTGAQRRSLAS
ncbi:MAG: hypothetical protein LBV73_01745 [Paraburkholderia sp.]|jgi:hypothetical protein|nr:hypothetical protein [Paraburkholderia sp.]